MDDVGVGRLKLNEVHENLRQMETSSDLLNFDHSPPHLPLLRFQSTIWFRALAENDKNLTLDSNFLCLLDFMNGWDTVSGHKSKREHQKARFYAFLTYSPTTMKPPGAPRQPLGEVSPNQRSRVVSAHDHGIRVPAIARMEKLLSSTCRSIIKNALNQTLCITNKRISAPSVLTPGDHRLIRRAIVVNPKITA